MGSEIPSCDKAVRNNNASKQTRGRQKKRTAKITFVTANNVRRMRSKKPQTTTRVSKRLLAKKMAAKKNNINNAKNNTANNSNNNMNKKNKTKKSKRAQSAKPVRSSKRFKKKMNKVNNYFW